MSNLVIEHLKAADLPRQWAERLNAKPEETFTVRIEAETPAHTTKPAFGLWRDRDDLDDVDEYIRRLREPRR